MIWLLKPAELSLKGGNRKLFELALKRNLQTALAGCNVQITMRTGRIFLHGTEMEQAVIEDALRRLIGISGWAQTRSLPKTIEEVLAACVD